MAIEVGFWRINGQLRRVPFSPMKDEKSLEDLIARDLSIVEPDLLLIGRQVITSHNKFIDLLAMDSSGDLVIIELKRDRTPREAVAQILDYGSWAATLESEDIAHIFNKNHQKGLSLDKAFMNHFSVPKLPDELNSSHRMLIVAGSLDPASERIITYLNEQYDVPINAVFFGYFKDGDAEYLSRAYLMDGGTGGDAPELSSMVRGTWNGEYYVSFGEGTHRRWEDARTHDFISAGGGPWYSRTLYLLEAGSRIWVNVPGQGYVGTGTVLSRPVPFSEFELNGKPVSEVLPYTARPGAPESEQEHFVRVDWLHTVPLNQAVREIGFFGNQNSAARPRTKKWNHTVERLNDLWSRELRKAEAVKSVLPD